ncbi:MAG: LuxR C-terminal-related transcriptional regulator [Leptolyngbyaceae cyanobacterium bins.349]|nr:LuxR C-terminal-related transcriptional regulator [Leptolyngbyaceae cyanobacterium bins.349]
MWQICEALIESQALHPEKLGVMESEVQCEEMTLRVRVQWLAINGYDRPCLLVRLQDQQQAVQTLAIAEAQHWHLTERESQVWALRRSGCSRKQIAAELYISEDTVKKHLGNVRAKRQSYLDEEDWQLNHSHPSKQLRSA